MEPKLRLDTQRLWAPKPKPHSDEAIGKAEQCHHGGRQRTWQPTPRPSHSRGRGKRERSGLRALDETERRRSGIRQQKKHTFQIKKGRAPERETSRADGPPSPPPPPAALAFSLDRDERGGDTRPTCPQSGGKFVEMRAQGKVAWGACVTDRAPVQRRSGETDRDRTVSPGPTSRSAARITLPWMACVSFPKTK